MAARLQVEAVRVHQTLAGALDGTEACALGTDTPLGLLESSWPEADRAGALRLIQQRLKE